MADADVVEADAPLSDICDELIIRMGHDPSNAPRSRVAVLSHKVSGAAPMIVTNSNTWRSSTSTLAS